MHSKWIFMLIAKKRRKWAFIDSQMPSRNRGKDSKLTYFKLVCLLCLYCTIFSSSLVDNLISISSNVAFLSASRRSQPWRFQAFKFLWRICTLKSRNCTLKSFQFPKLNFENLELYLEKTGIETWIDWKLAREIQTWPLSSSYSNFSWQFHSIWQF